MQVRQEESENGLTLVIEGIMKKADGMALAETISGIARNKPKKLTLDFTNLVAASDDSLPLVVSALERARIGKNNLTAKGVNAIVQRTLRGSGFDRIGTFEN